MKHFLVELTYNRPFEEFAEILPEHRAFLRSGYDAGLLLVSGPKVPRTGGVVLARADSEETLRRLFANDPYALRGVADYRFVEFSPASFQPFLEEWLSPPSTAG